MTGRQPYQPGPAALSAKFERLAVARVVRGLMVVCVCVC